MARRSARTFREELHEEPLLNLTALIDVVFVVLITFMILAPMLDVERVRLAEGKGAPGERSSPTPAQTITVTVKEDNTILVDRKSVSLSELKVYLERQKALSPKTVPKLVHDSRATFGTYQMIKNVVEGCGFEELDVILEPR